MILSIAFSDDYMTTQVIHLLRQTFLRFDIIEIQMDERVVRALSNKYGPDISNIIWEIYR